MHKREEKTFPASVGLGLRHSTYTVILKSPSGPGYTLDNLNRETVSLATWADGRVTQQKPMLFFSSCYPGPELHQKT